jgi:hypothetical protein
MLILTCCKTLLENHYYITMQRMGIRCLGILVRLIFKKSMQLAPSARASQKAGKILNLMQIDAQRFYDTAWFVHLMWSAVLEAVGSTILLFLLLGPSMLAGLAMMLLLVPLNAHLAKVQSVLSKQLSKATDVRMDLLAETGNGYSVGANHHPCHNESSSQAYTLLILCPLLLCFRLLPSLPFLTSAFYFYVMIQWQALGRSSMVCGKTRYLHG